VRNSANSYYCCSHLGPPQTQTRSFPKPSRGRRSLLFLFLSRGLEPAPASRSIRSSRWWPITMQAQDLIRQFRVPDLGDMRQYVRGLPTNILMGMGGFAAITTYWYATRPKALKPPCDLAMQSVEIEGMENARRSILLDDNKLMTHFYDDARTMYEAFMRGLRVSNNGPCLGSRKPKQAYEWLSYKEVADRAELIGSALLHRGHNQAGDKHIGIFAQNRPEV
ncbi:hypothetical protein NFI96_030034, partial [Prochilodus magdalenae]